MDWLKNLFSDFQGIANDVRGVVDAFSGGNNANVPVKVTQVVPFDGTTTPNAATVGASPMVFIGGAILIAALLLRK